MMAAITARATHQTQAPASPPAKVLHAAQQFEAMLLETLLGPFEQSFSSVPGGNRQPGAEAYQSLEVEALAKGLTARGGFGFAAMIARNLMKKQPQTEERMSLGLSKVLPGSHR